MTDFDRAGKFQKQHFQGANLCPSGLHSETLQLRHTSLPLIQSFS